MLNSKMKCMLCGKGDPCGSHSISSTSLKYFLRNQNTNCLYMPTDPLLYVDRVAKGYVHKNKYARMSVRTGNASVAPIFCPDCDKTFRISDIFSHGYLHKPEEKIMFKQLFLKAIGFQYHLLLNKINYWNNPENQETSMIMKNYFGLNISHQFKLNSYQDELQDLLQTPFLNKKQQQILINIDYFNENKLDIIYETFNADFTGLAFVDKRRVWEQTMNPITRCFLTKMPEYFIAGLLFNRNGIPFFAGENIPLECKSLFKTHYKEIITDFLRNITPHNTYYGNREDSYETVFPIYNNLTNYTLKIA